MMITGNKPGSQEASESDAQQELNEVPEQATDTLAEQPELEASEKEPDSLVEGKGVEKSDAATKIFSTKATGTDADETLKSVSEIEAGEVGNIEPSSNQEISESSKSKDGSPSKTAVPASMQNPSTTDEASSPEKSPEPAAVSMKSEPAEVNVDTTLKEAVKPLASDQEIVTKPEELSTPVEANTQTAEIANSAKSTKIEISEASSTVFSEQSSEDLKISDAMQQKDLLQSSLASSEDLLKISDAIQQKVLLQSSLASPDTTAAALSNAMSKLQVASPETVSDALESPVDQSKICVAPSNVSCPSPMDVPETPCNSLSQSPNEIPLETSETPDGQSKAVGKSADQATSTSV